MTLVAVACVAACPARVVVALEGGAGAVVRQSYCIHDRGAPGRRVHRADLLRRPTWAWTALPAQPGPAPRPRWWQGPRRRAATPVGLRVQAEPFLHRGALVSVEPLALAVCHEVVDALPRQFHHELPRTTIAKIFRR